MKKLMIVFCLVFLLSLFVFPQVVLAQEGENGGGSLMEFIEEGGEDDLEGRADTLLSNILYTYMPMIALVLLAIGFLLAMTGAAQNKSKLLWALIGMAGLALAPSIGRWLLETMGFFGG